MTAPATRPRPPVPVIIAVVLVYISGVLDVIGGIVTVLSRYTPQAQAQADGQLPITLIGAAGILIGLFTCALASGLFRGRPTARLIVTIALGVSFVVAVIDLIAEPTNLLVKIGDPLLTALIASALWFGGAGRHFARTA